MPACPGSTRPTRALRQGSGLQPYLQPDATSCDSVAEADAFKAADSLPTCGLPELGSLPNSPHLMVVLWAPFCMQHVACSLLSHMAVLQLDPQSDWVAGCTVLHCIYSMPAILWPLAASAVQESRLLPPPTKGGLLID